MNGRVPRIFRSRSANERSAEPRKSPLIGRSRFARSFNDGKADGRSRSYRQQFSSIWRSSMRRLRIGDDAPAAETADADSDANAGGYRLTEQQQRLIAQCWREANRRRGDAGQFIFRWLFAHYAEIKALFALQQIDDERLQDDARFRRHAAEFTRMLDMVVDGVAAEDHQAVALDDTVGPMLAAYGARHARIERLSAPFRDEYWEAFAVAMCKYASSSWRSTLLPFLSSSQKRGEALRAWQLLVRFIVAKVRQGYLQEKTDTLNRA